MVLGLGALEVNQPFSALVLLVSSLLNAVYYLPIVINAFFRQEEHDFSHIKEPSLPMLIPVVILAAATIFFDLIPVNVLLNLSEVTAAALFGGGGGGVINGCPVQQPAPTGSSIPSGGGVGGGARIVRPQGGSPQIGGGQSDQLNYPTFKRVPVCRRAEGGAGVVLCPGLVRGLWLALEGRSLQRGICSCCGLGLAFSHHFFSRQYMEREGKQTRFAAASLFTLGSTLGFFWPEICSAFFLFF